MQNAPRRVIYARPVTPKLKNDWLTTVLKIVLFIAIFFTQYFNAKRSFNYFFAYSIAPSISESIMQTTCGSVSQIMSVLDSGEWAMTFKYVFPLVNSAIIFLLYLLYAKFFAYLVFNQFTVINLPFNIRKFRICLDGSITVMSLLMGISRLIFAYYPIAANLGMAIVDIVFAVVALAMFFFTFSRGLEKKYYPVLLSIMLIPSIILAVVV